MEQTEEFKNIVSIIQSLEDELARCEETTRGQERKHAQTEKDIEDHFAQCLTSLAARKEVLMEKASNHINNQSMQMFFLICIYFNIHITFLMYRNYTIYN